MCNQRVELYCGRSYTEVQHVPELSPMNVGDGVLRGSVSNLPVFSA